MLAAEEEKARRLEAEFYEQMRMQKEREEAHRWVQAGHVEADDEGEAHREAGQGGHHRRVFSRAQLAVPHRAQPRPGRHWRFGGTSRETLEPMTVA